MYAQHVYPPSHNNNIIPTGNHRHVIIHVLTCIDLLLTVTSFPENVDLGGGASVWLCRLSMASVKTG